MPHALVAIFCIGLLWELLAGRPPASRDHALHLFEIHLLVDEFLPSGRVSGWTGSFNNGLPFGEAYPWFSDLWCAVPHLVTFGAISQRASYAFGLLAVWLLAVLGVWLLAAEIAREINDEGVSHEHGRDETDTRRPSDSRAIAAWAGCLAALIWLLDPGGSRQGGWNYLMFHGVWPQLLSATLWVLSIPLCWRAFRRPSPRRVALSALVLGGSVLAHPFGILTLVCSAAIWLAVLAFTPRAHTLPPGRYLWWLWTHSVATAIGFGWLASFLAGSEALGRSPVPWDPIAKLTTELVAGTLFAGHGAWAGPLTMLGLVFAVRRGGSVAWLTIGLGLGMLVLASQEALTVLRLDLIASSFKNLQFPRYSIAIKPLLYALAGVGGAVGVTRLRARLGPARAHSMGQRFVAGLVLAPFALALTCNADRLIARPTGGIESLRSAGEADHEAALRQALEEEKAALGETPLAVAFFRKGMGGGMYPVMSISAAGGRLVLDGHVATVNFEHGFIRRSRAGLLGMAVTHVIHDKPLDNGNDPAIAEILETVGQYGPYRLARVVRPADEPPPVPVTWNTDASVEVLDDGPLRWVLGVRGVEEPLKLRLSVPPHPKWTATQNGEVLEVSSFARWGRAMTGMQVEVVRDGDITLSYADTPVERRARWLALLAVLLSVLALAWGTPLSVKPWRPSATAARSIKVAALVAVAITVLGIQRRQSKQLATTWLAFAERAAVLEEGEGSLVSDAVVDGNVEIHRTPERACIGILGKNALDGCTESQHAPMASFMYRAPYVYRCIRFTVPPNGTAVASLPLPEAGATVIATLQRVDRKGKGRHLKIRTGAKWRTLGNARKDVIMPAKPGSATPTIEFRNDSGRLEPVCLAVGVVTP